MELRAKCSFSYSWLFTVLYQTDVSWVSYRCGLFFPFKCGNVVAIYDCSVKHLLFQQRNNHLFPVGEKKKNRFTPLDQLIRVLCTYCTLAGPFARVHHSLSVQSTATRNGTNFLLKSETEEFFRLFYFSEKQLIINRNWSEAKERNITKKGTVIGKTQNIQ
jgi:hypothetical protein